MTDTPAEVLEGLAERCEAASGPDRVERLLYEAFQLVHPAPPSGYGNREWGSKASRFGRLLEAGAFTDAALLLVPEGWRIQLSDWDDETLRAHGPWQAILTPPGKRSTFDDWWPRCDHAATPALALCAAALRARAALVGGV